MGVIAEITRIGLGIHRQKRGFLAYQFNDFFAKHAVAKVSHKHQIVLGKKIKQCGGKHLILGLAQLRVIDLVHFQDLAKEIALHKPPFDDGG